jgi:hypothetical protein
MVVPGVSPAMLNGDSEGPAGSRPSASTAPTESAKAAAVASPHRYGYTATPRVTAASTAVVKRSTSTTTQTPPRSAGATTGPHWNRTPYRPWPAQPGTPESSALIGHDPTPGQCRRHLGIRK